MTDSKHVRKGRNSMSSMREHTKQKTIDVELPDIQLRKERSVYKLYQNVQIVVVIIKLLHTGARHDKKLKHYHRKIRAKKHKKKVHAWKMSGPRIKKLQLSPREIEKSPLNQLIWNLILLPTGQQALESLQISALKKMMYQKTTKIYSHVNCTT